MNDACRLGTKNRIILLLAVKAARETAVLPKNTAASSQKNAFYSILSVKAA